MLLLLGKKEGDYRLHLPQLVLERRPFLRDLASFMTAVLLACRLGFWLDPAFSPLFSRLITPPPYYNINKINPKSLHCPLPYPCVTGA
jgi:hypothetical protein